MKLEAIEELTEALHLLPGIGRRTAERMAYQILEMDEFNTNRILDAIKSVSIKTIEVHLSDVTKREDFRQVSYLRSACVKSIMGKGFLGYTEAIDYFLGK